MTLTSREKALLFILVFIIIFSTYLHFLIFPKIDSIKENSFTLENERTKIKELKNIDAEEKLIDKANNIQKRIKDIEESLPDKEDIPGLYLHMLNISNSADIKQKEFIIQDTILQTIDNSTDIGSNGNEELLIIPIKHTFTSTYEGIKDYIEEIYNCERKIDVIEYEIIQGKNNELDAFFILHSYALTNSESAHTDLMDTDLADENIIEKNPFAQKKKPTQNEKKNIED